MKKLFTSCIFSLLLLSVSCSDYSENLGKGYTYVCEGKGNNSIFHEYPSKGGQIPPDVISYDYDKDFIIVKQKPQLQQYGYEAEGEYNNRNEDGVFYYWLIDKKRYKTIGPMDSLEFVQTRKKYYVSEKLNLNK